VLWPPREPTGYSLIVDGTAEVTDPGGLHDCVPLKVRFRLQPELATADLGNTGAGSRALV
jgi:hypothetical protein